MRRQLPLPTLIRIVSVCARVLLLGSGAASFGVHAAPSQQVTTFAFADAAQTYTVPAGVTQITVLLSGAQDGSGSKGNAGGLGGQATATIAVTPGETLQVNVGGQGGDGNGGGGSAGFNGGGVGTTGDQSGGGGGGASDIRRSPFALDDRLIVAGGGGGGGLFGGCGGGGKVGSDGSDGGGGVNSGNGSIAIAPIFGCEPDTSFVGRARSPGVMRLIL